MKFRTLFFSLMLTSFVSAQNNSLVDSLYNRWQDESLPQSERWEAFSSYTFNLIYNYPDSMKVLLELELVKVRAAKYYKGEANFLFNLSSLEKHKGENDTARELLEKGYEIAKTHGLKREQAVYHNNKGVDDITFGDYESAIKNFRKAIEIYESITDGSELNRLIHNTTHNIAVCYSNVGNKEKALENYHKSLEMRIQLKDTLSMLYSYINIGNVHMDIENLDSAVFYFDKSLELGHHLNDQRIIGFAEINLGNIYFNQQEFEKSIEACRSAQEAFRKSGNITMEQMGYLAEARVYTELGEYRKSIELTEKYQDTSIVPENAEYLHRYFDRMYENHKGLGEFDKALEFLEMKQNWESQRTTVQAAEELERFEAERRALQDSIAAAEERMMLVEGHQKTVKKKNQQRNYLIGGAVLLIVVALFLLIRWRKTRREKEASEEILDNILPAEISEELKQKGVAEAQLIENVTVLFTDFKGFTALSEKLSPKELVQDLNECFSAFDVIMEKYGMEKIKTIGDAYMAAGGLKSGSEHVAANVIYAALEMAQFIEVGKARKLADNLPFFEIRIGIHTGPVVAGIVGIKKYQYDIWGDTVNTASRMESSGEAGKVNISQTTYELVKDISTFDFDFRGKIEAKGKGEMEMYFASRKS